MEIEEAIKNLEKEVKCRSEQYCLDRECRSGEGGCPYFLNHGTVTKTLQAVVEWHKNVFAKNAEGSKNE